MIQNSETKQYHEHMVYKKLHEFFSCYFVQRDMEKTLSLVSDDIYSVGTGIGEVAIGKEALRALLKEEFESIPAPIHFDFDNYVQKQWTPGYWDCFCNLKAIITMPDGVQISYLLRLTANLHFENGNYIIDMLHASEANDNQESREFFPLKFISNGIKSINHKTKHELMEIISQVMPGGIVGGYAEDGFPLYIANDRLLKMTGYETYEEFKEAIHGLVINTIHPDDRDYVCETLEHYFQYSDQYEIQYRMKKKDGSFFWVHDIGRKTLDHEGKSAIISVIIDISEQINRKKHLEDESFKDALTGVYNRRGGETRISKSLQRCQNYMLFMLDLDNFKQVNDIYGHNQGDEVLRYVAAKMSSYFRETDTICRIGGDEFIIFAGNISDIQIIEHKIHEIIDDYAKMMQNKWPEAHSTLSAGGVFGSTFYTFTELYEMADEILYQVKHNNKGEIKIRTL